MESEWRELCCGVMLVRSCVKQLLVRPLAFTMTVTNAEVALGANWNC